MRRRLRDGAIVTAALLVLYIPWLASSMEYTSKDFTSLEIKLNPQAKWSDGVPVTAKDVVFTFEGQMKNDKLSPQSDPKTLIELQNRLGSIQGRLGQLQAQLAMQASGLSMQDEMLAGQQAQLAAEQAQREAEHERYGGATQKIINDAQRQLKPLIEQGIRDGRVKSID